MRLTRKINFLISTLLMLTFCATNTFAAILPLRIVVNNTKIDFPDAQPYLDSNGRVQVPVRFVSEALGATVDWNGTSQVVTIKRGKTTVTLKIGEKVITVNGLRKTMDTKAVLISQRTFVPVRFVSEALGAKVRWEQPIMTAYIDIEENCEPIQPEIDEKEIKYYSGIAFNPKTDVASDGRMKLDKAQEFIFKFFDQVSFYKKDGKYYVKGTYPELPSGFEFSTIVSITLKDGSALILNTNPIYKKFEIPKSGTINRHIDILKSLNDLSGAYVYTSVDMTKGFNQYGEKSECSIKLSSRESNKVFVDWHVFPSNRVEVSYDAKKSFIW